jgi:hypothetical protein
MPEPTTVPCKEKGCDKSVVYERTVVRGFQPVRRSPNATVTVYLTCPDGHTHKYVLPAVP